MNANTWIAIGVICTAFGLFAIPYGFYLKPKTTKVINPEELAKKLVAFMPREKDLIKKESEIEQLKVTINRLMSDKSNNLKQKALQELNKGNNEKAIELLEKSAFSLKIQSNNYSKRAAETWVDIGNIAYLENSQKAIWA